MSSVQHLPMGTPAPSKHNQKELQEKPRESAVISQSQSKLLSMLPVDMLYNIADHLPDVSIAALSLACKTTNRIFPQALKRLARDSWRSKQLEELFILLEKDNAASHFFCHGCFQLHKYTPEWKPNIVITHGPSPVVPGMENFEATGPIKFDFHHVRLVMNAHFLGPGNGVPLEQLRLSTYGSCYTGVEESPDMYKPDRYNNWTTQTTATIEEDQLIITVRHKTVVHGTTLKDMGPCQTVNYICPHLSTHDLKGDLPSGSFTPRSRRGQFPRAMYQIWHQISARRSRWCDTTWKISDLHGRHGFCFYCYTKYTITAEKKEPVYDKRREYLADSGEIMYMEPREVWTICITAVHQLGDGRDREDWKWDSFSEGWRKPRHRRRIDRRHKRKEYKHWCSQGLVRK
ncbi:hypothetical protein E8E14_000297 [Neopestalotiopsis sp. 37M]|nr:hypothetical protein E8E14_000297 [Neopestalotiopsis sp. 37M]